MPSYALTVTAHVDPPLADDLTLARRVTAEHLPGARPVMASGGDQADGPHLASWTVLLDPTDSTPPHAALAALHAGLCDAVHAAGSSFHLEELTAVTTEHLARQARTRERAQLVGVEELRSMLARDGEQRLGRTRLYELLHREDAPKPVRPGKWTRHQAEAFAAVVKGRPGPGRPSRES